MKIEARHLEPGDRVRRTFMDNPVTLRVIETIYLAHEDLVRVVFSGRPSDVLFTSYEPDTPVTVVRDVTLAA